MTNRRQEAEQAALDARDAINRAKRLALELNSPHEDLCATWREIEDSSAVVQERMYALRHQTIRQLERSWAA